MGIEDSDVAFIVADSDMVVFNRSARCAASLQSGWD